jgi:hypothetical protein
MRATADALKDATDALWRGVLKVDQATALEGGFHVPIDASHYLELDETNRVSMLAFIEASAADVGGQNRRFLRRD